MATIELTTSSQLKSANTESDIANHSGKANRGKIVHANEDIDLERSHLNVEFDFLDRGELLEKHYREKIDKHNKTNNSKARRWETMDDFLKTFEGKKVKVAGKETNNERWATMSQVTYVGDKDSMEQLTDLFEEHGATVEEFIEAYSKGYRAYVEKHNKEFHTLPIYHSDIHFDETTPHGHDAIVVMGHTEKGKPSDSLNNALGELYGYETTMEGKKHNMLSYRADNDAIAYECITGALKELAQEKGFQLDLEFVRTGNDFSVDVQSYKRLMDEKEEAEMELSGREAKLEERISAVEEREATLAKREADFTGREARLKKFQEDLKKDLEDFDAREAVYNEKMFFLIRSIEKRTVDNMHEAAGGNYGKPISLDSYRNLTFEVMHEYAKSPETTTNLEGKVIKADPDYKLKRAKRIAKEKMAPKNPGSNPELGTGGPEL